MLRKTLHEKQDSEFWEQIQKTGRQLSVRLGKFGPMAQIGTVDDEEKPLFASIPDTLSLGKITFEVKFPEPMIPIIVFLGIQSKYF